MENLNSLQAAFFNIMKSESFKRKVQQRSQIMGADGAFYFSLGELQSESGNYSFDELNEDQQDDFISTLILEVPELEF